MCVTYDILSQKLGLIKILKKIHTLFFSKKFLIYFPFQNLLYFPPLKSLYLTSYSSLSKHPLTISIFDNVMSNTSNAFIFDTN